MRFPPAIIRHHSICFAILHVPVYIGRPQAVDFRSPLPDEGQRIETSSTHQVVVTPLFSPCPSLSDPADVRHKTVLFRTNNITRSAYVQDFLCNIVVAGTLLRTPKDSYLWAQVRDWMSLLNVYKSDLHQRLNVSMNHISTRNCFCLTMVMLF